MENGHPGEVTPFPITGSASASEIAQRLAATAFQARNLGRAAAIWEEALRDEATVFMGLAGAMVPAGMRPLIVYLIENRLIDVLVSTGANLYHDVYETLGHPHFQSPVGGDSGEDVHLANLPIYRPAFGDSVHGLAVAEGRVRTGKRVMFDIIGDVLETAHMALTANKTGVVYVGGGTPKNFIQQAGVAAYLFQRERPGHSYGIQVTTDEPQWGGLSGCTFEEAQSWRKIAPDASLVTANVDATIGMPIIVSALAEKADVIKARKLPALDWDYAKAVARIVPQPR